MPHMHVRGKDFIFKATYPDGTSQVLLSFRSMISRADLLHLEDPLAAPKERECCLAHFDNSEKNKFNPSEERGAMGDQTWEEMMIGWTSFTYDKPQEKTQAVSQNK